MTHGIDKFCGLRPFVEQVSEECPIALQNGVLVTSLSTCCADCKRSPPPDMDRGELERVGSAVVLRGMLYCPHCERYTFTRGVLVEKDGQILINTSRDPAGTCPWPDVDMKTPYTFEYPALFEGSLTMRQKPHSRFPRRRLTGTMTTIEAWTTIALVLVVGWVMVRWMTGA